MSEPRRLCVGRMTPRVTRMIVPHARLGELARAAGQFREAGYEFHAVANPATLNRQTGESHDSGMRVTLRKATT